jgi:hypothetical protein
MSSQTLVEGPGGVYGARETRGQVRFARLDPATSRAGPAISAPGSGNNRKHPALAVNGRGGGLLAWTENTGWEKGGDLVWQVFDDAGRPTAEKGRLGGGIPKWSFPAVAAGPDGEFVLIR